MGVRPRGERGARASKNYWVLIGLVVAVLAAQPALAASGRVGIAASVTGFTGENEHTQRSMRTLREQGLTPVNMGPAYRELVAKWSPLRLGFFSIECPSYWPRDSCSTFMGALLACRVPLGPEAIPGRASPRGIPCGERIAAALWRSLLEEKNLEFVIEIEEMDQADGPRFHARRYAPGGSELLVAQEQHPAKGMGIEELQEALRSLLKGRGQHKKRRPAGPVPKAPPKPAWLTPRVYPELIRAAKRRTECNGEVPRELQIRTDLPLLAEAVKLAWQKSIAQPTLSTHLGEALLCSLHVEKLAMLAGSMDIYDLRLGCSKEEYSFRSLVLAHLDFETRVPSLAREVAKGLIKSRCGKESRRPRRGTSAALGAGASSGPGQVAPHRRKAAQHSLAQIAAVMQGLGAKAAPPGPAAEKPQQERHLLTFPKGTEAALISAFARKLRSAHPRWGVTKDSKSPPRLWIKAPLSQQGLTESLAPMLKRGLFKAKLTRLDHALSLSFEH